MLLIGKRLLQLVVVFVVRHVLHRAAHLAGPGQARGRGHPVRQHRATSAQDFREDNNLDRPLVVQWALLGRRLRHRATWATTTRPPARARSATASAGRCRSRCC